MSTDTKKLFLHHEKTYLKSSIIHWCSQVSSGKSTRLMKSARCWKSHVCGTRRGFGWCLFLWQRAIAFHARQGQGERQSLNATETHHSARTLLPANFICQQNGASFTRQVWHKTGSPPTASNLSARSNGPELSGILNYLTTMSGELYWRSTTSFNRNREAMDSWHTSAINLVWVEAGDDPQGGAEFHQETSSVSCSRWRIIWTCYAIICIIIIIIIVIIISIIINIVFSIINIIIINIFFRPLAQIQRLENCKLGFNFRNGCLWFKN